MVMMMVVVVVCSKYTHLNHKLSKSTTFKQNRKLKLSLIPQFLWFNVASHGWSKE